MEKFKNFCESNNIKFSTIKVCESKKTYKDFESQEPTDEHIIYLTLQKKVQGQDYIVLSRRAASAVLAKEKKFSELEVAQYEESYVLQMPANHKVLNILVD